MKVAFLSMAFGFLLGHAWGSSPTAEQIVAGFVAAQGGMDRLNEVYSLRTTGSFDVAGDLGRCVISRRSTGEYRVEVNRNSVTYISATDGINAWRTGGEGKVQKLEEKSASLFNEEARDFPAPFVNAEEKGHKIDFVGDSDVDGTPAFHLRIHLKSGRSQDWYIDKESHMVLMKEVPGWSEWFGDHKIVTWYMDYEEHDGLMLPMHMERETNETFIQNFAIESVEINPKLDDTLFAIPEEKSESK